MFVNFHAVPADPRSQDYPVTSRYSRNGNDLVYFHPITLQDAVQCKPVRIPTLDGRVLLLPIDEIVSPKTIKCITGEGMKKYKKNDHLDDESERGDLFVYFDIIFPKKVNNKNKERLGEILL